MNRPFAQRRDRGAKPQRRIHWGTGKLLDGAKPKRVCMFCGCRARASDTRFLDHYSCDACEPQLNQFVQRWFQAGGLVMFPVVAPTQRKKQNG